MISNAQDYYRGWGLDLYEFDDPQLQKYIKLISQLEDDTVVDARLYVEDNLLYLPMLMPVTTKAERENSLYHDCIWPLDQDEGYKVLMDSLISLLSEVAKENSLPEPEIDKPKLAEEIKLKAKGLDLQDYPIR